MAPSGADVAGDNAGAALPPTVFACASDGAAAAGNKAPITTLRLRREFLQAASAARLPGPGFLLQARKRTEADANPGGMRVGFTCSKKVGNAVQRNRAKRRLRALARMVLPDHGQPGWDYVLVGRPDATVSRDFAAMAADLRDMIARIHTKGAGHRAGGNTDKRAPRRAPRRAPARKPGNAADGKGGAS